MLPAPPYTQDENSSRYLLYSAAKRGCKSGLKQYPHAVCAVAIMM